VGGRLCQLHVAWSGTLAPLGILFIYGPSSYIHSVDLEVLTELEAVKNFFNFFYRYALGLRFYLISLSQSLLCIIVIRLHVNRQASTKVFSTESGMYCI